MKKTITIPEDLYDITVDQYLQIQAIPEGDEFRQVVETICILCRLSQEEAMAMEQKDIQHIGAVIGGILDKYDEQYPVERVIELDQRYGFHPNLSRITVAEFADIHDEAEVDVAVEMRMVFRIKAFDEMRGFRKYFWKATPTRSEDK